MIKEDAEKSAQEEKKRLEERMKKNRAYGEQLKKQCD